MFSLFGGKKTARAATAHSPDDKNLKLNPTLGLSGTPEKRRTRIRVIVSPKLYPVGPGTGLRRLRKLQSSAQLRPERRHHEFGPRAAQQRLRPARPLRRRLPPAGAPTLAVHRLHQAVGDGVAQGHDLVIVQQAEQVSAALRLQVAEPRHLAPGEGGRGRRH